MYYTTPVYQFRMKCHLCDNHFEIKTDPANLDYEIVSGARRQEKRFEASENGTVVPDEKATINKLALDAMFKLEHGDNDAKKADDAKPRIHKMIQIQDRVKDDYMANRILRDQMRGPRKARKAQAIKDNKLLKKTSLNIKLLPENDSDIKMASLLKLNSSITSEERETKVRDEIIDESIFDKPSSSSLLSPNSKSKTLNSIRQLVKRKREEEVESAPNLSSKSIGVTLKRNKLFNENSVETPGPSSIPGSGLPEISLKASEPSGSCLSLLSADYASSSSSNEDD